MPKILPRDEGYAFESIGTRAGQAWGWQDWGLCAAWGLVNVAAYLVTAERSPIGFIVVAAAATVLFVALGLRRRREEGRRPKSGGRS